jgi:glycosyltransferase involved in cell wall biosynthesis
MGYFSKDIMRENKKIIIFLHKFPYPPKDSTKLRIFECVIKGLKELAELEFLIVTWENPSKEDINYLKQFGKINLFTYSKLRFVLNALRAFFNFKPFQTEMFYFKKIDELFKNLLKSASAVYVHTIRLGKYLENLDEKDRKKVLLDFNDSIAYHYLNFWRYYPLFLKLILFLEGLKIKYYEKKMIRLLSTFSAVSQTDKEFILQNLNLSKEINFNITGTNFKTININANNQIDENIITFMGNLKYYPNYEGINYFLKNIWPEINKVLPDLKFYIIGQGEEKLKNKFRNLKNVIFTGFLENPYEIIQKSLCFISPVRIGAGIQGKVIEAMSLGKLVIVCSDFKNTKGFENYKNVLICESNTKDEWIKLIKWAKENQNEVKEIGEKAKKFVEENFSSERISNIYKEIFEKLSKELKNL